MHQDIHGRTRFHIKVDHHHDTNEALPLGSQGGYVDHAIADFSFPHTNVGVRDLTLSMDRITL